MEQIVCKKCTSPDCRGCNLLRLEQMLESGKLDALMDEKHGIKTGIDVRPVVRGKWVQVMGKYDWMVICSRCKGVPLETSNFCPNCGAEMRGQNNG